MVISVSDSIRVKVVMDDNNFVHEQNLNFYYKKKIYYVKSYI